MSFLGEWVKLDIIVLKRRNPDSGRQILNIQNLNLFLFGVCVLIKLKGNYKR